MPHPYKALVRDGKRVDEHRLVAGARYLGSNVIVHHKDGDKMNNDLGNLEIMSRSDHAKEHGLGTEIRPWPLFGPAEEGYAVCRKCERRLPFEDFPKAGNKTKCGRESMCRQCRGRIRRERRLAKEAAITSPSPVPTRTAK